MEGKLRFVEGERKRQGLHDKGNMKKEVSKTNAKMLRELRS